jgi:hypothetical protein
MGENVDLAELIKSQIGLVLANVGGLEQKLDSVQGNVQVLAAKAEQTEGALASLQAKVSTMEQELQELKNMRKEPTYAAATAAPAAPAARPVVQEIVRTTDEDENRKMEIIEKARRTIGFEPIRKEDIERQYKDCGRFGKAKDEEEAKMMACQEFMLLDMKVSMKELMEMKIRRVFAPRREGAETLYCEFEDMRSVHTVFRNTRSMRRKSNVLNYVPAELYEQYRALETICFTWRKEEGCRTRVRLGRRGFEAWRRRGGELQYSEVPLASLGEVPGMELHRRAEVPSSNLEQSPPAGRPGYSPEERRKRSRERRSQELSPSSRSPQAKKLGGGPAGGREGEDESEESEEEKRERDLVNLGQRNRKQAAI